MTAGSHGARAMRTLALAALLTAAEIACAAEQSADPRLRIVDYSPTLVLPLTAFVGYHVHFEFAPGEYFVNLGAGDTSSLDVGAEGSHLLLKPKRPTGQTNLTILTNRRAYFIDYRALGRPPQGEELVYSVVYRYAAAEPPAPPTVPPRADTRLDAAPPEINRDYWFCGSASLRPLAAGDDGVHLRLRFAPQTEFPAVFVRAPDGEETLVNTHVEDDSVIVHRLAERLILRRGREVGCVVDRGLRSAVRRAASGTVDAGVSRETREVPR